LLQIEILVVKTHKSAIGDTANINFPSAGMKFNYQQLIAHKVSIMHSIALSQP
jgi:hypothetical protein